MFASGLGRERLVTGLLVQPSTAIKRNEKLKQSFKTSTVQTQSSQSDSLPTLKSSLPKMQDEPTGAIAKSSDFYQSSVSSGPNPHERSNLENTLFPPPITEVNLAESTPSKLSETEGSVALRRNELKQKLKEWRRELIRYRQKAKEEIRSIDIALQNLRVASSSSIQTPGGAGVAVGSVEDSDSTAPSTSQCSPVSASNCGGLVKSDQLAKDRMAKSEEILQEVKGLEWTVVGQERRTGIYTGTALNGKIPHGSGTLVFADKEIYQGPFVYGVMHGTKGLLLLESGSTYEGEFRLNMKEGTGEEVFSCGSLYIGKYKNGVPHGLGAKYNSDGTLLYLGQWVLGEPCDKAKETLQNSYHDALSPVNQHVMHPSASNSFEDLEQDFVEDSSTGSMDDYEVSMYAT